MKTGDQVVCVKTNRDRIAIKGKEYMIYNTMQHACGCISFDIGVRDYNSNMVYCCFCNSVRLPNQGMRWVISTLFAPIQTDEFLSSDKIEKSVEEKIDIKLPETIES